ncbi:MAG TPA: tetratricopeptide repeat protein [Pyrinomonadaceae bacterium]|nr:tetratricopeptide repeat protein [Pyrinomonadaceae bacterium]
MNKLAIAFIAGVLALAAVPVFGQTLFGCAERNYNCQLSAALKGVELDPKNPVRQYDLASVWLRSGAYTAAIEAYTVYIGMPGIKAKDLAEGYNNRGVSYRRRGQSANALADFKKAAELVPSNAAFLTNQGNANTDLKNFDVALENYAAALRLDPRYARAYSGRGHLYSVTERPDDAIADFSKAIEYDPKDPENYFNRAVVYKKKGEHEKSVADYDTYIPLVLGNNVSQADGYINRGLAHFNLGHRDKALADFTKVIELDPKRANGYRIRALLYRAMKKDDLAAADEKKVLELAAGNER